MSVQGEIAGCTAPSNQRVLLIDPSGNENTNPPIYPCMDHPVLPDLLDTALIGWKYYTPSIGSIWTAPNAISHICVPMNVNGKLVCTGADWTNDVVIGQAQVLTDVQNCNLASVSWVIPDGAESDHAKSNQGLGPAWVASIVNQIGNNPKCSNGETYWGDTAIIIAWDDWGGWYDHVPPYRIGQSNGWGTGYTYGFRVPMLVVSAYTPAGYVNNNNHDFGSILHFVETNFGLGLIGPGNYADSYANDLAAFFSLSTARPFQTIPARRGAKYFLTRHAPPLPPDDD
jgi:phospholipase C